MVNGPSGVIMSAVVEGTDMAINLYDYLVGPVLLQGYVSFTQLPLLRPVRYFAVLRPWSIRFAVEIARTLAAFALPQ